MSKKQNPTDPLAAEHDEMVDSNGSQSAPSGEPTEAASSGPAATSDPLALAEEKVMRAHAELENFRRRSRRETAEQLKYANLPLVSDLLEIVDNLSRALATAEADSNPSLVEGVRLVQTQLDQVLEKHGCKRIQSTGQPFDPHLHSAIQMQASAEVPANHVLIETRSGFLLHDRVVRPAEVIVSTGTQATSE